MTLTYFCTAAETNTRLWVLLCLAFPIPKLQTMKNNDGRSSKGLDHPQGAFFGLLSLAGLRLSSSSVLTLVCCCVFLWSCVPELCLGWVSCISEPRLGEMGRAGWQQWRDRVCSTGPESPQRYHSYLSWSRGRIKCCTSGSTFLCSSLQNHAPGLWGKWYRIAIWPCPHGSKLCPSEQT